MIPNEKELTALIYDTLMENKQHPQFDVNLVFDQETANNQIYLRLGNGDDWKDKDYLITVKEIFVNRPPKES